MYSDFTQIQAQVGSHVEILEIDDLVARVEGASAAEVESKGEEIRAAFELAVPGIDPIAGEIDPSASSGLRASRSVSTRSCATSRSTG